MKKYICIFIVLAIALALVSCDGTFDVIIDTFKPPRSFQETSIEEHKQSATEETASKDSEDIKDISNGQIIYYADGIKVSYQGFDIIGDIWGPEVLLRVENSTDINYTVQSWEFYLNGIPFAPQLSNHAPPGETVDIKLILLHISLRETEIAIDDIENVRFRFTFIETDRPSQVFETDFVYIDLT
jgi:hypothetical protein